MATASASCRVLAFEDNYDIGKMLKEGGVKTGAFKQHWTTECVLRAQSSSQIDAPPATRWTWFATSSPTSCCLTTIFRP